ncbi:hypothetical protein [Pontibacillus yanchengensis]|uniref:Uncharacterized protein n=1 Tax=Pontibacillus yanchengensis Y32 TaxID=1385514 RepID=A0A0A2TSK6_9BACI|nr:hypothetical protein [Pontibacillus yanchengensis]KGP72230.1 hypothetical protein N782_08240 [Pontibacillus yanchengensis Y32]
MIELSPIFIVVGTWVFIFLMKYRHKKKVKNRIEYRKEYELSPEEVQKSGLRHPGGGGGG